MPHRFLSALGTLLFAASLVCSLVPEAHAVKPFGAPGTLDNGRFRALVVWVQDYTEWTPLRAPKKDAERIATALTQRFLFESDDVEVLGNPTQSQLFTAVKAAAVKAAPTDSLLIFFAGHGYLEPETGHGYWIPKDGKKPGEAAELSYLSSSWVRDVLKKSKALHVVVLSDSCFSGALLGSRGARRVTDRYYRSMYGKRSFEALTSGALETVNDTGAPDGHSPFAYYVAQALEKPNSSVFDTHDVFQRVREGVKHYSSQTPLFGRLNGAPSDGGAFVFVSRAAATATTPPTTAQASGRSAVSAAPIIATPTPRKAVGEWDSAHQAFREGRYDDALRQALRARFCTAGHVRGCHLLGTLYASGLGTVASPDKAAAYFAKAAGLADGGCSGNDEHSCYVLGLAYQWGYDREPDERGAFTHFQRACDLGHGGACHALALLVSTGRGTHQDDAKGVELFEKACRAGEAEGCLAAASIFREGQGAVRKSRKRAAALFKEACEGGVLKGCGSLGAMHIGGRGVKRDAHLGARYIVRGCDGGDTYSCTQMGMLYKRGIATKKSPAKAAAVWKNACENGGERGASACALLGELYEKGVGVRASPSNAESWYRKACTAGSGSACTLLGHRFAKGANGWTRDEDAAIGFFRLACNEYGSGSACKHAKKLNFGDDDDADADWVADDLGDAGTGEP